MQKKATIFTFLVIFFLQIAFAQKEKTNDKKQIGNINKPNKVESLKRTYLIKDSAIIFSDAILKSIVPNSLPQGWLFYIRENEFIIEFQDSNYILFENKINAPLNNETKEKKEGRIKTYGVKSKSYISYFYEPKWEIEKIQEATIRNTQIFNQLNLLEHKYGIANLIDYQNSGRQGKTYLPKNEKDKVLLAKYYLEENELKTQLIKLPNFHTSNYSLFLNKKFGCNDDFCSVYPESVSIDLYHIEMLFNEICAK